MADSSSHSSSDTVTARETLLFLGRELKSQRFLLRAQSRRRKMAEKQEQTTKATVRALIRRIENEIDRHPDMFRRRPKD